MTTSSKINPLLTLDYIVKADENKIFDRKSARIKIAEHSNKGTIRGTYG